TTKVGDKPVGALLRSENPVGTLVLLPDIDFYPEEFIKQQGSKRVWNAEATKFAARMVASIVALDHSLHSSAQVTPQPLWAADSMFELPS
ncbi:hypothetical protein MXD81_21475, partial [Microbacteriaceae bacterium K1510]|nr:hypothetical protein [Microbacteriaceae bacterium K1510]